jgi:hypothetical protein
VRVCLDSADEAQLVALGVVDPQLDEAPGHALGSLDDLAALGAARAAVLFVTLGADDPRRGSIAADRRQVALTPDGLPDAGGAQAAPLVDAAVAAALAINTDVRILPDEAAPPGGVGALLRW